MAGDVLEPVSGARIGRYQLLKKLAAGGMAEIYLARVTGVGGFAKNVVLKRILPQLAESQQFFRMFLDEARIAATLQHPNVIQVYDAGESDGQYYIAMEYLDGADLEAVHRHLVDRDQRLAAEHAAYIVSCVCAGLHYAHEKTDLDGAPLGIVHRDVTPQNVFVTRDGGVKLVDFGIAKASNRMSRTTHGTLKGKLSYMAPEQCEGRAIDRRSDNYALGVLLYEVTTGQNPHRGSGEYAIMLEIVQGQIASPRTLVPDYPPELEEIVLKAVAKRPDDRFQTAREMQRALDNFLRGARQPVSSLILAEEMAPLLDAIHDDIENRDARWADEVQAYEDYVAAKAPAVPEPRRRRRAAALAETEPSLTGLLDSFGEPEPEPELEPEPEPAEREPVPARGRAAPIEDIAPSLDIGHVELRTGRKVAALVLLLAVAGGGILAYQLTRGGAATEAGRDAAAAAAEPEIPERGTIAADSAPAGAAVWRMIGRAPVSIPRAAGSSLELRIVHEGYRVVATRVGAEADSVTLELVAADRKDREPSWLPGEAAAHRPGSERARVETTPPGAAVWVFAGETPDLEIAGVETAQPHELRFEAERHHPAFVEVTERSYELSGRARVHPTLRPRSRR
jgi:serine/threonine protein kinase